MESTVHQMLAHKRVSGRREFFSCDVTTARQVIEAATVGKLGRACRPPSRLWRKRSRRRLRSGDLVAWMGIAAVALVMVLALLKPSVPGWLPASVHHSFLMVERLG